MNDVHVVFGTGAIGLALIDELAGRGVPVRAVNRSGSAGVPEGVELLGGDVSDQDFASRAASGAAVVYQCLNPAYYRWAEDFPALQDSAIQAARTVDARLVSFENVYAYGDTGGVPITETTVENPHTRKGRVRLVMAEQLRRLHNDGELAVTTARACSHASGSRRPRWLKPSRRPSPGSGTVKKQDDADRGHRYGSPSADCLTRGSPSATA